MKTKKANQVEPRIPMPRRTEYRGRDPEGPEYDDECFLCGRAVVRARCDWIHLSTGLELIPCSEVDALGRDPDDSQGCFVVGSSCARKVPKGYRYKLDI
jgi:hypothetical protein